MEEASEQLRIPVSEVERTIDRAENHPGEMERVREKWRWVIETATAGRDDWEDSTPTNADESLFGDDLGDETQKWTVAGGGWDGDALDTCCPTGDYRDWQ